MSRRYVRSRHPRSRSPGRLLRATEALLLSEALEQRVLLANATGQLYFVSSGDTTDQKIAYVPTTASTPTNIFQETASVQIFSPGTPGPAVVVDTAANLYFVLSGNQLLEGNLTSSAAPTVVGAWSTFFTNNLAHDVSTGDTEVDPGALAIDLVGNRLFIGVGSDKNTENGFVGLNYGPATGAVSNVAYVATMSTNGAQPSSPEEMVYNNNIICFIDNAAGSIDENGVYRIDLGTHAFTQIVAQSQFPIFNGSSYPSGGLAGIALDPVNSRLYFSTRDANSQGTSQDAIYEVSPSASGATATKLTVPAGTTLFEPDVLTFDRQTNTLYIGDNHLGSGTQQILRSQLNAGGTGISSIANISPGFTHSLPTIDSLYFDTIPTLAVSGTTTHATEQGAFVDATASQTLSDDGNLIGATVQITGGTFSSNEASTVDDHLSVLDGGTSRTSGLVTGTNTTVSYNSATETLMLSGYDSITNYNTVLGNVRYNTTGDNPTNYGANPTRTITWTVSDGALNVPAGSQNSTTSTLNIDAVNDPPVNDTTGPLVGNEDADIAIHSIDFSDPDANQATQAVVMSFSVLHGTVTVATNVAGGVTAANVTGNGTASVSVTGTYNAIVATMAAVNGFRYHGVQDYFGPETMTITTNDQGNTGSGGPMQDSDPQTITVNPVDDPPSFTKGPDQSVNASTGAVSITNWATNISKGPANESSQTLNFIVTNNANGLFSAQPAVSPTGTLTFTAAANQTGTATVSVSLHDDGTTANGGVDTSPVQTFTINVDTAPPAAPSAPDLQAASDSGASNTDNLTNATTATFDLSGIESTATVQLLRDGSPVGSRTGNGSITDPGPISAGLHTYTAIQTDAAGNIGAASSGVGVTFDRTAPQIVGGSTVFVFDTTVPMSVHYSFSENVGPSVSVGDIAVQNLTTATAVPDAGKGFSYDVGTNVLTFAFPGFTNGVLPNGNYENTIAAANITDLAGNPLAASNTFDFFFQNADANRDRVVDTVDFNVLAANFGTSGKTFSKGNFSYDAAGVVDTLDFNILAANFGKSLPSSAPAAPAAIPAAAPSAPPFSAVPVSRMIDSVLRDVAVDRLAQ